MPAFTFKDNTRDNILRFFFAVVGGMLCEMTTYSPPTYYIGVNTRQQQVFFVIVFHLALYCIFTTLDC